MKKNAYWWEIDEKLSPIGEQPLPKETDFVVVGGGYTGLSAGLTLARQGNHLYGEQESSNKKRLFVMAHLLMIYKTQKTKFSKR